MGKSHCPAIWQPLDHQSNRVDPKRLDRKIIEEVWALNKVWVLTIFIFWWRPSKILVSLKQTLNPCSSESSTHIAMLSCGLPGDCWMGVTSTTGGDRKRWNDNGKSKPLKIDKRKKQMAKKSNISVDCDLFRDSGIHIANLKVHNSRAPY